MQTAQETRKQILVVEDEGLIADDIQRRLERLGYAVPAIASSGEEALRFAKSTSFDLVLMDIRLQGEMDGIAAAQALKDQLQTPVVYLTAHADADTLSRATLTEPLGYILKPVGDLNLRSTVQIALYKHEMERRVQASEAWLSTTLRSVGEGIVATNAAGEIVFVNAEAERLTGWTSGEAMGRPLTDVLRLNEESGFRATGNPLFGLLPDERRWLRADFEDGNQHSGRSQLLGEPVGGGAAGLDSGGTGHSGAAGNGSPADPVAEVGGDRQPGGRAGARLQQSADGDLGVRRRTGDGTERRPRPGAGHRDQARRHAGRFHQQAVADAEPAGSVERGGARHQRGDWRDPAPDRAQPGDGPHARAGVGLVRRIGARRPQPVEAGIPQPGAERAGRDAAGRGTADLEFAGRHRRGRARNGAATGRDDTCKFE